MSTILDLLGGWQVKAAILLLIVGSLYGWHYIDKTKAVTKATTEYEAKIKDYKGQIDSYEENIRLVKSLRDREEEARRKDAEVQKRDYADKLLADNELDKLLNSINKASSSNSPERSIGVGAAFGELFGDCSKKYTDMAETATRHAREVKLLLNSWPKPDACGG